MGFEATATEGSLQHDTKTPLDAISLQASPPETPFHLQFDRLFGHQLGLKCLMLFREHQEQGHQALPLLLGELERPAFPTDQGGKVGAAAIKGQTPAGPFLLNHPGSRSG